MMIRQTYERALNNFYGYKVKTNTPLAIRFRRNDINLVLHSRRDGSTFYAYVGLWLIDALSERQV